MRKNKIEKQKVGESVGRQRIERKREGQAGAEEDSKKRRERKRRDAETFIGTANYIYIEI